MQDDPVVQEIREYRRRNAERFGFDIRAIAEDARSREAQSGHPILRPPKRPGRDA
mgnify:CR=1 FL=1